MKSFIIKRIDNDLEITTFNFKLKGFNYRLKNNNLEVKEVIILNPEITNKLIDYNFNKKYKKILEYYLNVLQEEGDSTDSKLIIALDEITRLRGILIRKYNKYLSEKMEEKLLKRLKILENEIRSKIIDFKLIKEIELVNNNIVEEKLKSR